MTNDRVRSPDSSDERLPHVSVVIISKNNHMLLEQAVASIGAVDYPREKLQVVVLEETDAPRSPAPWIDYQTIPMRHLGFGFARNRALQYARNPVIVFTDDDCIVAKEWLLRLVAPFDKTPDVMAVGGAVFVPPCGAVGQCENIIGFPGGGMKYYHLSGGRVVERATFSTCNCAILRSAIDAAGGFDEAMKFGGEDERISRSISARGKVMYQPHAIVYHRPRGTLRGVFGWFVRRGFAEVNHALVDRRSSYSTAAFLRNALLLRVLLLTVVSAVSGVGMRLFFPALLLYYAVLLWKYRWARRYYPSLPTLLLAPVVRIVMDTGRDWGIVKALCTAKKVPHGPDGAPR